MDARRSEICAAALRYELMVQSGRAAMNVCRLKNWFVPVVVPLLIYGCAAPRPAPVMERQPDIRLPAPAAQTRRLAPRCCSPCRRALSA